MTAETQKKLLITAMQSRTEKAITAIVADDSIEHVSYVMADYIWNIINLLDLMGDELASLTSRRLDLTLQKK